jgi:hypothetical protein
MEKILFLDDTPGKARGRFWRFGRAHAYGERVHQALASGEYEVLKYSSGRELFRDVRARKPQAVVINEEASALRKKLLKKYPFLSLVLYGELSKEKKINRLLSGGVRGYLRPPFDGDSVTGAMKKVLWSGIAKEELWDDQLSIVSLENRQRRFGNVFTCLISLGIVLGLLFGANGRIFTSRGIPYTRVYSTPYRNPTGLTLYGNSVWICDWKTQNIYRHSPDSNFTIRGVYSFPEKRFSDLTFAAGYMWTCAPWDKKFYKHKLDANMDIVESFDSPGPNPMGLDFDGKYMWACDNSTDKIYQLSLDENLEVVRSYDSPGSNPVGIFCDGSNIWTADSGTNRIYKQRLDDKLSVDSEFIVPDYIQISSIDGDSNYLWICSEKSSKIYRYPKKLLEPAK